MEVTVQPAPELQAQLAAEAQARGLALESYIVEKLEETRPTLAVKNHAVTLAIGKMRVLREGAMPVNYPIKDLIYEEHKY